MQIKQMTFADLLRLLEGRRDFTASKRNGKNNVASDITFETSRRLVFMLSDAFDLFKVDQEVIFDSA